ncbi:MAG: hypothetical protein QF408_09645 [Pirellulales bacterium]|nr:hypothetical protein [Pirellulales bacterium]
MTDQSHCISKVGGIKAHCVITAGFVTMRVDRCFKVSGNKATLRVGRFLDQIQ